MTTEKTVLQQALEHLIENAHTGGELRDYSGRGMYGKECLAIDCEVSLAHAVSMTQFVIGNLGSSHLRELMDALENTCTDSLGMGTITYWPSVPYIEGD